MKRTAKMLRNVFFSELVTLTLEAESSFDLHELFLYQTLPEISIFEQVIVNVTEIVPRLFFLVDFYVLVVDCEIFHGDLHETGSVWEKIHVFLQNPHVEAVTNRDGLPYNPIVVQIPYLFGLHRQDWPFVLETFESILL